MSTDMFEALVAGNISTFAELAFCTPQQPSGINDAVLMQHLNSLLTAPADSALTTVFRRLAFEAQALALQNLKSRLERTNDSEPKVLPLQEKLERIRRQQQRLGGISFTPHNCPAHSVIDKASQQVDDGVLQYIPLHKCGSRYAESLAAKTHPSLRFNADGHIKVTAKAPEQDCDISSLHLLRAAMQRRALAYDAAGAVSYEALESWAQMLFDKLAAPPLSGWSAPGVQELISWVRLSEHTQAKLGQSDPITGHLFTDDAILALSEHPEVVFHFLPTKPSKHSASNQQADRGRKRPRSSHRPPANARASSAPLPHPHAKSPKGAGKSRIEVASPSA